MSDFDHSDRPTPFQPPRIPSLLRRPDMTRSFAARPPIDEDVSSPPSLLP